MGNTHAPLCSEAVLDAVSADARKGEVLHDLVEEDGVDGLDGGQGVGRQLDGAPKPSELVSLLDHLHLKVTKHGSEPHQKRQQIDLLYWCDFSEMFYSWYFSKNSFFFITFI